MPLSRTVAPYSPPRTEHRPGDGLSTQATPAALHTGYYEDVLVPRVRERAPEDVWRPRFETINAFERTLADEGVALVKVFLHISRDYQRERQLRRLQRVDKRWKFDERDLDDR